MHDEYVALADRLERGGMVAGGDDGGGSASNR
jgi:hypothetical protein